jgi:hypothetical protein
LAEGFAAICCKAKTMIEPCTLPDGRRLFRLDYFVRLTEDHPMHAVADTGKLIIWVYERDIASAAARAQFIFDVLPFQISNEVIDWEDSVTPDCDAYELLVDMVERVGYATFFRPDEKRPNERGMRPKKTRGV